MCLMFGLRSSARCVFMVSVAVFVVSRSCCCCCNVLGRIFACFIVSALSLGPRPRPLPHPPTPYAMRVPMFLILYIDIWPPGCQKREPLPKVDCGSLSEARSVGGGSKRRRRGWRMPIAIDWAWVAVVVVVGGNFALEICMICATPFVMHLF